MATSKKPQNKGKNRLIVGEMFGHTPSPKIVKLWEKGWRKVYSVGPKGRHIQQS